MIQLQLAHELYACVYPVRLELEEVEPTAQLSRLAREVDEFGEGASDLGFNLASANSKKAKIKYEKT